ncbi:helix-turn-helix transcriptional regulator [Xanthomonas campestris]|uniref:helix-turn-helix transcriptional regulator n=1 Tax=Xanthomonas campestris TaxID=339 RepID=UPI003CFAFB26
MTAHKERPAGFFLLPASVQEVAEVIALPDAMRLAGAFCPASGGPRRASHSGRAGRMYIPQRPNGDTFQRIAHLVGHGAATRLIDVLGGNQVAFPPCTAFTNRTRDASVPEAWRDSTLSEQWIGWLHEITERQVRNITKGEPRPAFDAAGRPLSKSSMTSQNDPRASRLINSEATACLVGVALNTLAALVREGDFPAPIRLGPPATFYDRDAVRAWVDFQRDTRGTIRSSPGRPRAA